MNTKIQNPRPTTTIPSLSELLVNCQEWQSELSFWEDELQELKQLIFQYAYLGNEDQLVEFKVIGGKVGLDLPEWLGAIRDRLYVHQNILNIALENGHHSLSKNILTEHQSIQQQQAEFRDECTTTKAELQQLLDSLPVTEAGYYRSDHSRF